MSAGPGILSDVSDRVLELGTRLRRGDIELTSSRVPANKNSWILLALLYLSLKVRQYRHALQNSVYILN